MYFCVRHIDFSSLYDFSIGCWNRGIFVLIWNITQSWHLTELTGYLNIVCHLLGPVSGTRRGVYQIDSEGRGPTQRTLAMEREAHYDVADQPADFKRHPNVSYSTAFCWFFLKVIECSSWLWSYVVGFITTCAISAYHH